MKFVSGMEFSLFLIVALFSLAMMAAFVQRVCGFGFGIFIMTMLPYLMPSYGEAVTLSGMLSATQSVFILSRAYKYVAWKRMIPILLTFLVVSFVAIQYVSTLADNSLKILLGIMLIVMSLYFLFVSQHIQVRPSVPLQISMGSLSGVMGGFFGMQGPPAVLYFLASEKDKEHYLAMAQIYFFIGNVAMTLFRAGNGLFTHEVRISWIYAVAGVAAGTYLGKLVFERISIETLRKIVYVYMAISGVIAIVGAVGK